MWLAECYIVQSEPECFQLVESEDALQRFSPEHGLALAELQRQMGIDDPALNIIIKLHNHETVTDFSLLRHLIQCVEDLEDCAPEFTEKHAELYGESTTLSDDHEIALMAFEGGSLYPVTRDGLIGRINEAGEVEVSYEDNFESSFLQNSRERQLAQNIGCAVYASGVKIRWTGESNKPELIESDEYISLGNIENGQYVPFVSLLE